MRQQTMIFIIICLIYSYAITTKQHNVYAIPIDENSKNDDNIVENCDTVMCKLKSFVGVANKKMEFLSNKGDSKILNQKDHSTTHDKKYTNQTTVSIFHKLDNLYHRFGELCDMLDELDKTISVIHTSIININDKNIWSEFKYYVIISMVINIVFLLIFITFIVYLFRMGKLTVSIVYK